MMRHKQRSILTASVMLGAALVAAGMTPVWAQGEDAAEVEAPAEVDADAEVVEVLEDCTESEDCADEVATEAAAMADAEDAANVPAASAPAEPEAAAADGAVLVTPGSTDESNPGGSTRPGTRPDD